MSTIFIKNTSTDVQPRKNATIRVQYFHPKKVVTESKEYRPVLLLEFYPDTDNRAKFRGRAYVRPEIWMDPKKYPRIGADFLEPSEQYVEINEVFIHDADRRELMSYCASHDGRLIIHPCPRPYPMFKKDERVTVVAPDHLGRENIIGALATVAEDSNEEGGMTSIIYDNEDLRTWDGRTYPSTSIANSSLRLAMDYVRAADYSSLVIAPLWRYYEAARIALAELDALGDSTQAGNPTDWAYIKRQKAKMRKEIKEFEQRFPDYKGV